MRFAQVLVLVVSMCVAAGNLFGQAVPALSLPEGAPDTIFYNGKIVTVNSGFSTQEAFAVKGDQFLAVGSNAQVRKLAGPKTRQVDLKGHTVIPGLIDSHNHEYAAALASRGVDVVGVSSLSEMLDRIRLAVAKAKPGEIVFTTAGYTFRPEPTRQDLDQISAKVPIVVPGQGHQPAVLNTAALHAPEAPPGLPTGASPGPPATSPAALPKIIPPPTQKEVEELLLRQMQKRNAEGLTSIRDLNLDPGAIRAYYRLWLDHKMTVRVG
ncbi:MAG: amidohydrolase family protein, partial [Terriglobia bacterium]